MAALTSAATAAAALTVTATATATATAASEVDIERGRKRRGKDKVVAKLKRAKLPTYIVGDDGKMSDDRSVIKIDFKDEICFNIWFLAILKIPQRRLSAPLLL